jgi:hypothetical protein
MAQGSIARKPVGQQVVYLRRRLFGAVASGGGNGTYTVGWIPAGSNIVRGHMSVRTVFSGGTPAGTAGSRASPANVVAALATHLTTAGHTAMVIAAGAGSVVDVDTEIVAVISGTPTAGVADIQFEYIPPDERPA